MLGCDDRRRSHRHKFDVGNGHARPFCLFLSILHHDNELGNDKCLRVILPHISAEGDHVDGMQPPTVGVKEGHDVDGRDFSVESLGIFEIVVPDLVNDMRRNLGRHVRPPRNWHSHQGSICGQLLHEHGRLLWRHR